MALVLRDQFGRLLAWLRRDEQEVAPITTQDDIVGTRRDDYLEGTTGSDQIDGRKGADTMVGGEGDDVYIVDNAGDLVTEVDGEGFDTVKSRVTYTLAAGLENLTLEGRANVDAFGNAEDNQISGNSGDNLLDGAEGNDTISAHRGKDSLLGGAGDDSLDGGQDDDTLDGGSGIDTLIGGLGDDTYTIIADVDQVIEQAGAGHDTVRAAISITLAANVEDLVLTGSTSVDGTGNDLSNRISGNKGANKLAGAFGDDELIGHKGNDTLLGGDGNDYLDGSADNDSLDGGVGADHMLGGTGNDSYVVDDLGDVVVEDPAGGVDLVRSSVTYTLGENVENLTLTFENVPVNTDGYGNALANVITGSYSQNLIDGGEGDDTIDGGGHISPWTADTLIGGAGNDSIRGGGFMYSDLLYGGTGNDTLSAVGGGALYGDDGDDVLIGGAAGGPHGGGNLLEGGAGDDSLTSGMAQYGGDGNDSLHTEFNSTADGGAGNDTITGSGGSGYWDFRVNGDTGDDWIDVRSYISHLIVNGGEGADNITASSPRSVTVDAGVGDDIVLASGGGEGVTVRGGDGNDQLSIDGYRSMGGLLDGGAGDDILSARTWDAGGGVTMSGGAGHDTLHGSGRLSRLNGGEGSDMFVLSPSIEWYFHDTVEDFSSVDDTIAVSQSEVPMGDGDLVVDNATTAAGPGQFSADAELVLLAQDIIGSLSLDVIAQAFGEASTAYQQGQTAVFVASNGTDTWVLKFESSGSDAVVSAEELTVMGALMGAKPLIEDIVFIG